MQILRWRNVLIAVCKIPKTIKLNLIKLGGKLERGQKKNFAHTHCSFIKMAKYKTGLGRENAF